MGLLADYIMHKVRTNYLEDQAAKVQGLLGTPGQAGPNPHGEGLVGGTGLLGALQGPASGHLPAMQEFAAQVMSTPGYGTTGSSMLTSLFNQGQSRAQDQAQYERTQAFRESDAADRLDILQKTYEDRIKTSRISRITDILGAIRGQYGEDRAKVKETLEIQQKVKDMALAEPGVKENLVGLTAYQSMIDTVQAAGGFDQLSAIDDNQLIIQYYQLIKPREAFQKDDMTNILGSAGYLQQLGIEAEKFIDKEGRWRGIKLLPEDRMRLLRASQARARQMERQMGRSRDNLMQELRGTGRGLPGFMTNYGGMGGVASPTVLPGANYSVGADKPNASQLVPY